MKKRLIRSHTWKGVTLRAGMRLWSNPSLRGSDAEIPIVMAAPTLFDLVVLAERKPVEELRHINDRLRAQGEITERQHAQTEDFLNRIDAVNSTVFGLWKDKQIDGLTYQQERRSEW